MNTNDLIYDLAHKAPPVKPLKKPTYLVLQFLLFALIYYMSIQAFMGIRGDISIKFAQPFFVIEIFLMLLLLLSWLVAAVLTMYPDNYQKVFLPRFPYLILTCLLVFFTAEIFLQNRENLLVISKHSYQCTLCIAAFAVAPSLYFFYVLRKGTNLKPLQCGAFATVAATSISAIALRISETNDLFSHLLIWHYFPVLVFSALGAFLGKQILKW